LAGVAAGLVTAFSSALAAGAGAGVALLVSAGLAAFAFASASFSAFVFGFSTLGISFGVAGTGAVAAAGFLTSSTLAGVEAKADVAANATIRVAIRFFILSFLLINEL
jgi:hypothetical protein